LIEDRSAHVLNERLGALAHELRNHVQTATLAIFRDEDGERWANRRNRRRAGPRMIALRTLIDKSLADVRMTAGMPVRHQLLPVAAFIAEVNVSASLEAQARGIRLTVGTVDPTLMVEVDRDLLFSAIGNLYDARLRIS
jgi:hypothetical protein